MSDEPTGELPDGDC